MTEIQIMDSMRSFHRFPMPSLENSQRFDVVATKMSSCVRTTYDGRNREMTSFNGCPPLVMAKTWELLHEHNTITEKAKDIHLLWGLHYAKEYPNVKAMCKTVQMPETKKPDDGTVSKWLWIVLEAIADLQPWVIDWERRKTNDRGNDCTIGIDGKDAPFQQIKLPHPTKTKAEDIKQIVIHK